MIRERFLALLIIYTCYWSATVLAGGDLKKKQLRPNHVGSSAIWSLSWLL